MIGGGAGMPSAAEMGSRSFIIPRIRVSKTRRPTMAAGRAGSMYSGEVEVEEAVW
jgi:hypothetical protein